MSSGRIAVDGRFLTMTATGVQRYGREILPRLAAELGDDLRILVPPDRIVSGADTDAVDALLVAPPSGRWHGGRGHAWEQLRLPGLVRRSGAVMLWSPCNWGPLVVRRQVPVIHDIGPLTDPQWFDRTYRLVARGLTRPLVTRSELVATPSARVARELSRVLDVPEARIAVVPPGVGEPFASWPLDDVDSRPRDWCVFVGAHDARKNVGFVLDLWPEVFAATGLRLRVTRRSIVTTRGAGAADVDAARPGVDVVVDPSDDELAALYAGALCLLWPSHFEGYGFPLLEAMAVGTPFLATDTGAAAELAVDASAQLAPLDRDTWVARLTAWAAGGSAGLRGEVAGRARALTWDRSTGATVSLLRQASAGRGEPA